MELRGYVRGQFLAEHSTYIEIEERYALTKIWGINGFTGVGCLYGKNLAKNSLKCTDSNNLYPNIGGGITYALKPEENIIIRAEVAIAKEGNYAFYLQPGQAF